MYWKQKHTTPNSVVVWARSESAGTLQCTVNGQSFTGDAVDPSDPDTDGCGTITITGLSASTSYSFTLTAGSDSRDIAIRTHPDSVDAEYNVMIHGCWSSQRGTPISSRVIANYDPILAVNAGDEPYTDQNANNSGALAAINEPYSNTVSGDNAAGYLANMMLHFKDVEMDAELASLKQGRECFDMLDDHEMPGGNFDHSLGSLNQDGQIALDQADVDNVWIETKKVYDAYHAGNCPNTDSEAVPVKPEFAQAGTDASNYPVRYARKTIGSCEFFFLDCKTSTDGDDLNGGSAASLLGSAQRAWLAKYWTESTATFKVIFASKSLNSNNADNFWDMARNSANEADTDYDYGFLMDLFNSTGHPVFFFASDLHLPHVFEPTLPTVPVYDIVSNPVSRGLGHTFVDQPARNAIWHDWQNAVGVLHVHGNEYIQPLGIGSKGQVIWRGPRWYAGDSDVTEEEQRFSYS